MTVINIVGNKDAARVLKQAVLGIDGTNIPAKGTHVVYWSGMTWSLSEHGRKVAEMARLLEKLNRVFLVQKKTAPERYEWIAVVR